MSASQFNRAFAVLLREEGGYVDDARDPGGKTRYGITEAVARAHGYAGEMRNLPVETAQAIYRASYWDAVRGDDLPWPLNLYVFDCAVNQGAQVARILLQRALDTVQDGALGPVTLRLAQRSSAWHQHRFLAMRAQRYTGTRNYDRFGLGWLTRLYNLVAAAHEGSA